MNPTFTLNKTEFIGNLADPQVFEDILFFADLILDEGSGGKIYKFQLDLQHLIQQQRDSLGQNISKYQDLLLRLRLSCLQLLSDEEIGELLKSKMSEAHKQKVDLIRNVSLFFIPFFMQEDYTRLSSMERYLESNAELIGGTNIALPDGKVVGPLVSNWLKDYKLRTPENKGSLNLINYITQSGNCKKLDQNQLEFLKYVLNFYDWLRFKASKVSYISEEGEEASVKTPNPVMIKKVAPVNIPVPPKPIPAFEKKLASVSAPVPHRTPSPPVPPVKPVPPPVIVNTKFNEEIRREVTEPELPAHMEPFLSAPKSIIQPKMGLISLDDIRVSDDLKKIELAHIRVGALYNQMQTIKNKILHLAQANHVLPYYTVSAFEQSPLFKLYLSVGDEVIHDNSVDRGVALKNAVEHSGSNLTLLEFEAIADLRKEIERL